MSILREYLAVGLDALFLKTDVYERMRAEANPLVKGLTFIVLVGVIVAAFSLVGTVLEWSISPDTGRMKAIILEEMQQAPFYKELAAEDPAGLETFRRTFDQIWDIVASMAAPNIPGAALNIILNPIWLVVTWLLYGILAFLFVRLLGGTASLAQTLGCLALAVAPQMLAVANVVPNVETAGLGVWTVLCSYQGLKVAGQLSSWRALWATLLPFVVWVLLVTMGIALVMAIFIPVQRTVIGAGGF